MQIYKTHDIEVPESSYKGWNVYRKGFKNVRANRVEEGTARSIRTGPTFIL